MLKIGSKLALICAVSAFLLGIVNMITEPQIAKFRAEKLKAALEQVSPGGTIGELTEAGDPVVMSYYKTEDAGEPTGYILNLKGSGYGGNLIILASYKPDGSVYGVVLMQDEETPGLGKEAEKSVYMEKYLGFSGNDIPSMKNQLAQADADTISGATITFAGIGKALISGSEYVKNKEGM